MRVGDGHRDPELGQGLEGLVVEGGDRLALEWDRHRPAVHGVDAQLVVDEVEVDGEDGVAMHLAHGPGGDASPVRWNGTFHQWLRRTLAASRILPTTWQNRCSVCLVSRHSASGIGGNSSMPGRINPDGSGRVR